MQPEGLVRWGANIETEMISCKKWEGGSGWWIYNTTMIITLLIMSDEDIVC